MVKKIIDYLDIANIVTVFQVVLPNTLHTT